MCCSAKVDRFTRHHPFTRSSEEDQAFQSMVADMLCVCRGGAHFSALHLWHSVLLLKLWKLHCEHDQSPVHQGRHAHSQLSHRYYLDIAWWMKQSATYFKEIAWSKQEVSMWRSLCASPKTCIKWPTHAEHFVSPCQPVGKLTKMQLHMVASLLTKNMALTGY